MQEEETSYVQFTIKNRNHEMPFVQIPLNKIFMSSELKNKGSLKVHEY